MKTITLHCDCGAERTFRGADTTDVMAAIDAANWEDQLYRDESNKLPKGHGCGDCPACVDKRQHA